MRHACTSPTHQNSNEPKIVSVAAVSVESSDGGLRRKIATRDVPFSFYLGVGLT